MNTDFLRPIIEETFAAVSITVPDHRGRRHAFRLRDLEKRRDALRFEFISDTHYEELRLAVRLTTVELKKAFDDSDGPAAFAGEILHMVSKAAEIRLAVPCLLNALEWGTTPRVRDRWNVRRISAFGSEMYLEAEPSNAGEIAGKAWIHTKWVGEVLRDVAGRWERKDAEELARRLEEGGDSSVLHEAVPERTA